MSIRNRMKNDLKDIGPRILRGEKSLNILADIFGLPDNIVDEVLREQIHSYQAFEAMKTPVQTAIREVFYMGFAVGYFARREQEKEGK